MKNQRPNLLIDNDLEFMHDNKFLLMCDCAKIVKNETQNRKIKQK